ncbi:aminodeoxychorismate synthase component I [Streptomyces melanogenes]|uniref:aminodeoxychorismate synthase component I n=1 Tax=Streptomyces melanogenes TaxID=67326 RepID=UPI00167D95FB|nr:aminodeoxychorismate synthase component I [Streptomyces melanogenes]GGP84042.1 aminodeoxychorismate synthase, component I [Streptomyces melanogenes]
MRTLIIDNYDSFTHNLYHYIGQTTGTEPVVVRNDDPAFVLNRLRDFDNVVISPGPGSPDRPADFGVCADVIRDARIPVLGVCLGHQGICHVLGGRVEPAPEVRHGRSSKVEHNGQDLFEGLPSPFEAVRYHSLIAAALPEEIEPVAFADDGVLMGIRHRTRPLWGVQFHPESISTEHGLRLMANFASLTRRWQQSTGTRPAAPAAARTEPPAAADRPYTHRVIARRLEGGPALDPEVVFAELYGDTDRSFWLDSSLHSSAQGGRFSFMGDARGPLARTVAADVWEGSVTTEGSAGTNRADGAFFDWIRADLATRRVEVPTLPFGFALGWVGYLGYELKAETGGDRVHRSPHPDAGMIFADRAVAFDHATGDTYLLALAEAPDPEPAEDWLRRTEERLRPLAGRVLPRAPRAAGDFAQPRLRHAKDRYLDLVAACQKEIEAGETYEVCLTNIAGVDGALDPWAGYRALRRANPVPFAALLRLGGLSVLSCSPERFLQVTAEGVAESKPIKGTRPRAADPVDDELLRTDLANSVKDRAENLMIVDLVRNDLGSCAELGSVTVDPLFAVESFTTVHQLVSTVRARLRQESTAVDCVRAAFPGGSMTGAPKIRTMQIIDRLEEGPRGVYSGSIGYFSLSGACDFNIVIRTLVTHGDRVEFGVGGAVIALSDAQEEFEETAVKATAPLTLLGLTFPGRDRTEPDAVHPLAPTAEATR